MCNDVRKFFVEPQLLGIALKVFSKRNTSAILTSWQVSRYYEIGNNGPMHSRWY